MASVGQALSVAGGSALSAESGAAAPVVAQRATAGASKGPEKGPGAAGAAAAAAAGKSEKSSVSPRRHSIQKTMSK